MKVILNNDVPNLGELGDVRDVAPGYARNFLFPRNLAYAFNHKTAQLFERRKTEIEDLKAAKRMASSSLKERLEAEEISVTVPAGANGKLYGAVTGHTVADELLKKGIEVDRKKIEVPGRSIKNVGTYKVLVHLYDKEEASLRLVVLGSEVKSEAREETPRPQRRRRSEEGEHERPQLTPEEDIAAQAAAFEAAVNAPPRPQRRPRREER
ncbi:MAG TPA: 50S ribosomal protein L9 [Rectinemataceae bacterium]|nr:50S ribosomal protein L9 [Rectinemataceae bacterium]